MRNDFFSNLNKFSFMSRVEMTLLFNLYWIPPPPPQRKKKQIVLSKDIFETDSKGDNVLCALALFAIQNLLFVYTMIFEKAVM